MRTLISLMTLSLWCLFSGLAQAACTLPDLKITGYNKEKIGVFSADGKFLREVSKEMLPLGTKVIDCNSLGLGLVQLVASVAPADASKPAAKKEPAAARDAPPATAPGEWIELLDVKVSQQFQPPCVPPPSTSRDKKQHGTAGVASGDCVPVAAPAAKPGG